MLNSSKVQSRLKKMKDQFWARKRSQKLTKKYNYYGGGRRRKLMIEWLEEQCLVLNTDVLAYKYNLNTYH